MAAEEKRSITIKVNGQEVAGSIKLVERELAKARLELKKSEIGSKEYNAAMSRVRELAPILNKHNADIRGVSKSLEDVGGKAKGIRGALSGAFANLAGGSGNPLGALVGAAGPLALVSGAVAGLASAFRAGFQEAKEFEKAVSDLKVRTGITQEGIESLKDASIELGKAYGTVPKDIIKAFGEAASARPELAKNTEELKKFTEQGLILSKITGDDINTSISNLASIMNTNGIATSDTADAVNILVGAAQMGAKEVPFLADAMQKVGGAAASANVGLSEQAAVLEVLGEKVTKSSETAGTALRNILITLQKEWGKTNEGPFNLQEALNQLAPSVNDITSLTEIFGKENVVAAQSLLANRERVAELKSEIDGFGGAAALAAEAQNNLSGVVDKLSARFAGYWSSLSEGNGIIVQLVGGFDMLLQEIEDFASDVSDTFGLIFNTSETTARLAAEQAAAVADMKRSAATDLVESKGLDEAKKKLDAIVAAQQQLNQESERYKQLQRDADAIRTAIADKEANLVEAENARAKAMAAEESQLAAQRQQQAAARAAEAKKREQEQIAEITRARELTKLENEKIQKIGTQGLDRGTDFLGREGQGSLVEDPIQLTIDLEQRKREEAQKSFDAMLDMRSNFEAEQTVLAENADRERYQRSVQKASDAYDQIGRAVFQIVAVGAESRSRKELAVLNAQLKQGLISQEEFDKRKEAIERRNFERQKRLNILEATMAGALAFMKALTIPIGGQLLAAGIAVQTAAQIAVIAAQKFEKGGVVHGKSHSDGGELVEVEGGEFVVRKRSVTARTLPVLRAINEGKFPQVNFAQSARRLRLEAGGQVMQAQASSPEPDPAMMMIVNELRAMRSDLSTFERELRVINVKEDADEFNERIKRVEQITAA